MSELGSGPLTKRNVVRDSGSTIGANMTPMVDVVLVILIFFMGSATIAGHEWFLSAGIKKPDAETQTESASITLPPPVFRVRLERSGGQTYVTGVAPDPLELGAAIDRVGVIDFGSDQSDADASGVVVELGATDSVTITDVVRVHDALNARGVRVTLR